MASVSSSSSKSGLSFTTPLINTHDSLIEYFWASSEAVDRILKSTLSLKREATFPTFSNKYSLLHIQESEGKKINICIWFLFKIDHALGAK